jgi:putative ATP-dependent endonuclease of OLD family
MDSTVEPLLWVGLATEEKELADKGSRGKKRLNRDAPARMTVARLAEEDPQGEVSGWLMRMNAMLLV